MRRPLLPPVPTQCDSHTHQHCNPCIYESFNHCPAHVVAFQFYNPIFGQRHSSRLPVAHQHFHLHFQTSCWKSRSITRSTESSRSLTLPPPPIHIRKRITDAERPFCSRCHAPEAWP